MHAIVFLVYAGLVAFVSLRPGDGASIEPWDKLAHLLVYYIFAVFGYRALRASGALRSGRAFLYLCLGIIAYGGLLELAQSYTPGRFMSVYDLVANTLGVVLGAVLMRRRYGAGQA